MAGYTRIDNQNVPAYPSSAAAITPSDATVFGLPTAVYVNTTGNVVLEPWNASGGTSVTFTSVAAGTVIPGLARRVLAATTAGCIGLT